MWFCLTRVEVLILLGEVLVLVHPLPVALEEDLQRGHGTAAQLDGVAFDDVGLLRLLDEVRQGALRRGQRVGLSIPGGACEAEPRLVRLRNSWIRKLVVKNANRNSFEIQTSCLVNLSSLFFTGSKYNEHNCPPFCHDNVFLLWLIVWFLFGFLFLCDLLLEFLVFFPL